MYVILKIFSVPGGDAAPAAAAVEEEEEEEEMDFDLFGTTTKLTHFCYISQFSCT